MLTASEKARLERTLNAAFGARLIFIETGAGSPRDAELEALAASSERPVLIIADQPPVPPPEKLLLKISPADLSPGPFMENPVKLREWWRGGNPARRDPRRMP